MGLNDLELELTYRSDKNDVYSDFYEKCISESIKYDRAVGYFTSSSLKLISQGLENFLKNNGEIRIITSPHLLPEDLEAIQNGENFKGIVENNLLREWNCFSKEIENNTLKIFSWLISIGKLEIRIAYQKDFLGIYYEKFGIFEDAKNNSVSFTGSVNETIGGMKNNFESIDVYTSDSKRDLKRINEKKLAFEKLWRNETNKIEVITIPEALKLEIIKTAPNSKEKLLNIDNKSKLIIPNEIKIRDYQKKAFNLWKKNEGKGILEMATGTGKTITALYIMSEMQKLAERKKQKICFIIVCPEKYLVNQWSEEVNNFNMKSVLCYSGNNNWKKELKEEIRYYKNDIIPSFTCITTNLTFQNENFQNIFYNNFEKNVMIISDECHSLGTKNFNEFLQKSNINKIKYRLGLSATPNRYLDPKGNKIISDFLGEIVFQYSMEEAIGKVLTPYDYYVHFIKLTKQEEDKYIELTKKISKAMFKTNDDKTEYLDSLLNERARLIYNAENKLEKLKELLLKQKKIENTLIYVGPGKQEWEDERTINLVEEEIKQNFEIKIEKFTSEENEEKRNKIINEFKAGYVDALVAIKCLDQGVNIPCIETAYILASSVNPREYIQRRGRVLRQYINKEKAIIHDFVVIPRNYDDNLLSNYIDDNYRSLLKKELIRVKEFARLSSTQTTVIKKTRAIQDTYKLYVL